GLYILGVDPKRATRRWRDAKPVAVLSQDGHTIALGHAADGSVVDARAAPHSDSFHRADSIGDQFGVNPDDHFRWCCGFEPIAVPQSCWVQSGSPCRLGTHFAFPAGART